MGNIFIRKGLITRYIRFLCISAKIVQFQYFDFSLSDIKGYVGTLTILRAPLNHVADNRGHH